MLLGNLPPIANAKDDAFILYSEDGEHISKMRRSFFTADIEQVGCDYWKEGTGDDKRNLSGAYDPFDSDKFDGTDSYIGGNYYSRDEFYSDKNYYMYTTTRAKKYCHYGDYWFCFKLREGETEIDSNFIVAGTRAAIDATYLADPSQVVGPWDGVSRVGGYPVAIYKFVSGLGRVYRYLSTTEEQHLLTKTNVDVVASYNKFYGRGLKGVKTAGNVYTVSIDYAGTLSPISGPLTFRETPPITHTDTYTYKYDEEVHRIVNENYYTDYDYDASEVPAFTSNTLTWTDLYNYRYNNPKGVEHCLWKLGIGNDVISPPTQIQPSFCHVLPVANTKDIYHNYEYNLRFLNAPRGALRSIPVVGVESFANKPIYDGYREDFYDHGRSSQYYMSVEDYYSYVGYEFYWPSRAQYPMRNSLVSSNMVGSSSYYYINDINNAMVTQNYVAMSRKGIEARLCLGPASGGEITNLKKRITIGIEDFMEVDDVDGLSYSGQLTWHNSGFAITKYGDNNLEIDKAAVNPYLDDTGVWPTTGCDFVATNVGRFRDLFVASDDLYFDDKSFNSVYGINPETNVPNYTVSLKKLWKLNLKTGGDTLYTLNTTITQASPSSTPIRNTVLNLTSSNTKNYGFGNEFTVDTTSNKVTRNSERVDSSTVRRAGVKDIRANSIVMRDSTGCYQSIRLTDGDAGTSTYARHANMNAKFRPEDIYYCVRYVEKNALIPNEVNTDASPLFKSYRQIAIGDIAGWPAPYNSPTKGSLYLVCTVDSNGYFSVISNYYNTNPRRNGYITETLPTSEDGYYYVYLGEYERIDSYANHTYLDFAEINPIYFYKDGRLQEYHYGEIPDYIKDFLIYQDISDNNPVSIKDSNGKARLDFGSEFANEFDPSTGLLTLKLDMSQFALPELDYYINNDDEVITNLAASTTSRYEIQGLKFSDSSIMYYIDVVVIFRTTDGTDMTDGIFTAWLTYSPGDDVISGLSGEPVGYYKQRKEYIPGESEVAVRMRGYINNGMGRGLTYPKLVVNHTCSTNIDVGYSITGYRIK